MIPFRHIAADTETDGLLPELTKLHCLVLRCLDTGQVISCTDASPEHRPIVFGLALLRNAERFYFHNAIEFDIPAIQKVYPDWKYNGRVLDTLTICRTQWAHIKETDFERYRKGTLPAKMIGSHSLKAWGYRLGMQKGEHTDWSQWSPEMQAYCEQDTAVLAELVKRIRSSGVSAEAVETEMELAGYLRHQHINGVPFNMERATALYAEMAGKREALRNELVWYVPDGPAMEPKRDNSTKGYLNGAPFQKIKLFNPKSNKQIENRLRTKYGWQPEEFTETGQAKVSRAILSGLDYADAEKLKEWLLLDKIISMLAEGKQAWMKQATQASDSAKVTGLFHIHGSVNQSGAITHRATHRNPNLGQVPKVGKPWGKECRELFTVPRAWKMLGSDASGLELRNLAHYMARFDDGAYVAVVTDGDVHSVNREALGLPAGKEQRDRAKTWFYAYLYGSGDDKAGSILEPQAAPSQWGTIGKKAKGRFLNSLPALKYLTDALKAKVKKPGYLIVLDGRRTYIRHDHAVLNTLLQSAGAVICKRWIVEFNRRMTARFGPQGWDGKWAAMLWVHDEIQIAVRPEIADEAARIAVAAIEAMTEHFRFRCPLTGEAKLGSNWAETH